MTEQRVVVSIVARTDNPLSPEHVCTTCKHFVRLDAKAHATINAGGRLLCLNCASEYEQRYPGTFNDENLADFPDVSAYPSSKPA